MTGCCARWCRYGLFAEEYFKLFDKNGKRPDQDGDRGLEYRILVGIPGGSASPLAKELVQASIRQGDKMDFAKGKGDDPDVKATVFVMDTERHPFFVGEAYHQFHDGFAWGEDCARAAAHHPTPPPSCSPCCKSTAWGAAHSRVRLPSLVDPQSYNNLAKKVAKAGGLPSSSCPNGMLGVGIAGL